MPLNTNSNYVIQNVFTYNLIGKLPQWRESSLCGWAGVGLDQIDMETWNLVERSNDCYQITNLHWTGFVIAADPSHPAYTTNGTYSLNQDWTIAPVDDQESIFIIYNTQYDTYLYDPNPCGGSGNLFIGPIDRYNRGRYQWKFYDTSMV